jgi:Cu+-exporting ATPase
VTLPVSLTEATPTDVSPAAVSVPCASCGAPVDPLRAGRVAFIAERFRYFCHQGCRERFDLTGLGTPLPRPRRRGGERGSDPPPAPVAVTRHADPSFASTRRAAEALADVGAEQPRDQGLPARVAAQPDDDAVPKPSGPRTDEVVAPLDVDTLLLALATLGGSLAALLALAGPSSAALSARLIVVVVACGALVAEYLMGSRDAVEPHPAALLAAPVAATVAAAIAWTAAAEQLDTVQTFAAVVVATTAAGTWLMRRGRRSIELERETIASALEQRSRRVVGEEVAPARAADLRPGEEIVVERGEIVPADGMVIAGAAVVSPWLGAKVTGTRAEGDPIVAGARVLEGRLRIVVAWTGHDRAFCRLTLDPRRRADVLAQLPRAGRLTAERAAPLAAGLAALTAFAANHDPLGIAMFAIAGQAALANAGIAQIAALHVARAVLGALQRGVAFRTAEALDRTGRVSIVAFCARGTLLLGEPEVANVEPIGQHEPERVLSLVAGAESGASHPVATAVMRAARSRGIRPDGVRSPSIEPGLGVTAIASSGQSLWVGSRALMLRERVSVASAEQKITDLEAMGRTVLLVALGGRLVGVVGLQDGLRPGARAAVQHLLDVGVEPVLLSGDARETCEALARALDIDHVRPELLPGERGDEIRRLADGGAVVAVIGRSPGDDLSLSAADVSVVMAVAGSSSAEWSAQLASDDVRDAAYAVYVAHRCRSEARAGLVMALAPAVVGATAVAFSLTAPVVAPLAALAGLLAALLRFRSAQPL